MFVLFSDPRAKTNGEQKAIQASKDNRRVQFHSGSHQRVFIPRGRIWWMVWQIQLQMSTM